MNDCLVLATKYIPSGAPHGGISLSSLYETLHRHYPTDAHFSPYVPSGGVRRVNKREVKDTETSDTIALHFLVFDIDTADHSDASAEWVIDDLLKLQGSPLEQGAAAYQTRGGYRLLWRLPQPLPPGPAMRLHRKVFGMLGALGIQPDPLHDFGRLFRLPYVVRDGVQTDPEVVSFSALEASTLDPSISTPPRPEAPSAASLALPDTWEPLPDKEPATDTRLRAYLSAIPATEGNRNQTAYRVAAVLLRDFYLEPSKALEYLNEWSANLCTPPLEPSEIETVFISAVNSGSAEIGRLLEDKELPPLPSNAEEDIASGILERWEEISGVPPVFVDGGVLRYNKRTGVWDHLPQHAIRNQVGAWNGRPYVAGVTKDGEVKHSPLRVSLRMRNAVHNIVTQRRDDPKWVKKAAVGLSFTDVFVEVTPRGREEKQHNPEHRQTVGISSTWASVRDSKPATFLRFLDSVFGSLSDKAETIQTLREFIGAALIGTATKYQKAAVFVGDGANGKSTLADIITALFPRHATTAIPPQLFGEQYWAALLAGKRLNVVSELSSAVIKHSEAVKAMISGDPMHARHIRESAFTFIPTAAHIFSANKLPPTGDFSDGFWRRWLVFPFNTRFSAQSQIPGLAQKILKEEKHAIIAWALEGAAQVVARGRYLPSSTMADELTTWLKGTDYVISFLEERTTEIQKGNKKEGAKRMELYRAYRAWCEDEGIRGVLTKRNFYQNAERRGLTWSRINGAQRASVKLKSSNVLTFAHG